MRKCYDTYPCIQLYTEFDNASVKGESFFKGCALARACGQYEKGNITEECFRPFHECKGKCCYEDECNKGNILDSKSSGNALAISGSALGLLFGLSLIVDSKQNILTILVLELREQISV